MTDLARRLRAQAEQCGLHGSPLTARILYGAAEDYEDGGPTYDLIHPHADDVSGSVPALRLAGALHRLVLQRQAPELALHYPSVGGTAGADGVWPVVRETIGEHLDQLRIDLRRPVQTNEVGRSVVLYGGLLHVAARTRHPVRLLEIGASAGLNLLVDRYAYDVADGVVLGDPASPVRLHRPWHGAFPSGSVEVADRAGCDPAPLDPLSTEDRLTLTSYVWPDQVERLERLRGALHLAADAGVQVERLPASEFLERELAEPRHGVATVVWHSVVRQYMEPHERSRVTRLLREAGERATPDAPLAHLFLEPDRIGGGKFRFVIGLTTWPGAQAMTLGEARGHGPPVTWA